MESPMTERSRSSSFGAWYETNADDFNAKRRERYQADPTLRSLARARAAAYRQRMSDSIPDQREGLNTTARVAYYLGISPQTLRNWEARYLIPKARYGNAHRLYTDRQMELLKAMSEHPTNTLAFAEARRALFRLWDTP
jgi:DNA-binding transcriptional regulator YiaG